MIKYYLLDDDKSVINILKMIIEQNQCGVVCGYSTSAQEALEDLPHAMPDIVIADLLMPDMDGITFVRLSKEKYPHMHFVMLSQVSSKDMIARAYTNGIEFYIQKPVNSIEVLNVISKVNRLAVMNTAFEKMQVLFAQETGEPVRAGAFPESVEDKINMVLNKLGIAGDTAGNDIVKSVGFILEQPSEEQMNISEICAKFSTAPKSMEQRMRRAAAEGLRNIANLGLEDYNNEIFNEYASTLFKFEQVRREMDYIRGKSKERGKVYLRNFLYSLAMICKNR